VSGGLSSAYDSDTSTSLGVRYHENALAIRNSDRHIPLFVTRMIDVGIGHRKHILKHGCRFVEVYFMLLKIRGRLGRIPLEDHDASIPSIMKRSATLKQYGR